MCREEMSMTATPNKALQPTADGRSGLSLTLSTHSYHHSAVAELTSEVIRQEVFQVLFAVFFTGDFPSSM